MKRPKRLDLRVPLEQRVYAPVDKPIMVKVEKGFQPPAKEPCRECPLARTASPGHLGGYTVEQYIEVMHGPADLACHMSPGFPDDRSRQRSCTGLAMYRANARLMPGGKGAFEAMLETGPNRELAFATPDQFRKHHKS